MEIYHRWCYRLGEYVICCYLQYYCSVASSYRSGARTLVLQFQVVCLLFQILFMVARKDTLAVLHVYSFQFCFSLMFLFASFVCMYVFLFLLLLFQLMLDIICLLEKYVCTCVRARVCERTCARVCVFILSFIHF